mgnify:CR=1 FL=1
MNYRNIALIIILLVISSIGIIGSIKDIEFDDCNSNAYVETVNIQGKKYLAYVWGNNIFIITTPE